MKFTFICKLQEPSIKDATGKMLLGSKIKLWIYIQIARSINKRRDKENTETLGIMQKTLSNK